MEMLRRLQHYGINLIPIDADAEGARERGERARVCVLTRCLKASLNACCAHRSNVCTYYVHAMYAHTMYMQCMHILVYATYSHTHTMYARTHTH